MKENIKKNLQRKDLERWHREHVKKLNKLSRKNPGPLVQWLEDTEQILENQTDEIVGLIKKYRQEIFNRLLKDKKSFDDYSVIKKGFEVGNILNNNEFKETYKRFYKLNIGGLGENLINKYFELLQKREKNLEKILIELSKIPRLNGKPAVLLVFASKLIHTVDNNQPIYDSRVAEILDIRLSYNIKNINDKINDRLAIYNLLQERFNEILKNWEIKQIIKEFKKELKTDIGDVKMLDFMLWKLGDIFIKKLKN